MGVAAKSKTLPRSEAHHAPDTPLELPSCFVAALIEAEQGRELRGEKGRGKTVARLGQTKQVALERLDTKTALKLEVPAREVSVSSAGEKLRFSFFAPAYLNDFLKRIHRMHPRVICLVQAAKRTISRTAGSEIASQERILPELADSFPPFGCGGGFVSARLHPGQHVRR